MKLLRRIKEEDVKGYKEPADNVLNYKIIAEKSINNVLIW